MTTRPWPRRVGSLLLREAVADDLDALLALRNNPGVNRFTIRTHVDPDEFRAHWLALPTHETDFSCVAELDGDVVAIGFLDVVDGMAARVLEKAGMRREQHGIEDSWHAELGWVDGYTYAILAREWFAVRGGAPPA